MKNEVLGAGFEGVRAVEKMQGIEGKSCKQASKGKATVDAGKQDSVQRSGGRYIQRRKLNVLLCAVA